MTTAESSTDVLPGLTNERHPDIFNLKARPKITEKKPGQLPDHMIKQFFEDVNIIFHFEMNFRRILKTNKILRNACNIVIYIYYWMHDFFLLETIFTRKPNYINEFEMFWR